MARFDPAALDADSLAQTELVILDHPGQLSNETIAMLAGLLTRGRSIWYVAAEVSDAINLAQLAAAAGSTLKMPVEFSPPAAGRPRRDLFWAEINDRQQPFSVFGDTLKRATAALRFAGGLATSKIDGGLSDDLVAQYGDQSAALVICVAGTGTLAVLNADLGRSNLPASAVFVPLVDELVERLLGDRKRSAAVYSGEPMAVYLPGDLHSAADLRIAAASAAAGGADARGTGELSEEPLGVVWRMAAAAPPGIYRVERGNQTVFAVASELPTEESDLRSLSADVLGQRMAGGRHVEYRSVDQGEDVDDLWTWLAVATMGVMLVELVALRMFRV